MLISEVVLKRPFKVRNADEFPDENLLELFVDPTTGVSGPFDFGNEIIKGKMGTGKTMYLRANYIYYLSTLVPQMIDHQPIVLPVYVKLSDYQNITNPEEIYFKILIRIINEILDTSEKLKSAGELAALHSGIRNNVFGVWFSSDSRQEVLNRINKMTSEEYIEQVTSEIKLQGSVGNTFVNACGEYGKSHFLELKKKLNPSIEDINFAYASLLKPVGAQILLLFDEVGSINKCFFEEHHSSSFFETLMNQLRTMAYIRTKIAIYPHTFADILTETRYGDVVALEEDVYSDSCYEQFLPKALSVAEAYIAASIDEKVRVEDVFEISKEDNSLMEQLIYASGGNMRRLVQLFDATLNECYMRCKANERANITDAINAIKRQAETMLALFHGSDSEFLKNLTLACKNRTAFRFRFPNKSPLLLKFTNKSEEYNIIQILESGAGRRGTIYWFDYAYCVASDIPTHYQYNSEKIARTRSKAEGTWITRITQISDELLLHASLPGKIEGTISYLNSERSVGFINNGSRDDIFFMRENIIETDKNVQLTRGQRVRFIQIGSDKNQFAYEIELM